MSTSCRTRTARCRCWRTRTTRATTPAWSRSDGFPRRGLRVARACGAEAPERRGDLTMRRLFLLALGGAVGYVLGTRAGRQRYDQIVDLTTKAWQQTGLDERSREVADQASQTARQAGDWVAG